MEFWIGGVDLKNTGTNNGTGYYQWSLGPKGEDNTYFYNSNTNSGIYGQYHNMAPPPGIANYAVLFSANNGTWVAKDRNYQAYVLLESGDAIETPTSPGSLIYFAYNKHYYQLVTGKKNYNDSVLYAQTQQLHKEIGYLATLATVEEHNFITKTWGYSYYAMWTRLAATNLNPYSVWKWDSPDNSVFWANSTNVGFAAFYSGNPSGGGENYLEIIIGQGWNDCTDGAPNAFMIEYDCTREGTCSGHGECSTSELSCACDAGFTESNCSSCVNPMLIWPACYIPPVMTCNSWGDPHFAGFDGNVFEFNGVGEFRLLTIDSVDIQVRQEKCENNVSCTTGVAVQVLGSNPLALYKMNGTVKHYFGTPDNFMEIPVGSDVISPNLKVTRTLAYLYEFTLGSDAPVRVTVRDDYESFGVSIQLFAANFSVPPTIGLCGAHGTPWVNSSLVDLGPNLPPNPTPEDLIPFAESWRVNFENSLFTNVIDGQRVYIGNSSSLEPGFVPNFNTTVRPDLITTANTACAELNSGPLVDECQAFVYNGNYLNACIDDVVFSNGSKLFVEPAIVAYSQACNAHNSSLGVSRAIASYSNASGPGLSPGVVTNKTTYFTINIRNALDQLSNSNLDVKFDVLPNILAVNPLYGTGLVNVSYIPMENITYTIQIVIHGFDIMGSPFYVNVTDINECNGENNCHPNSSCIDTIGYYYCKCNEGFLGDGHTCYFEEPTPTPAPLDVCANNGGCDYHVNCIDLGNGQRNCSACPNGTIGTGYSKCNTTCGDERCSAENGEDCLHCPQDCNLEDCGLCGDRACDSPREDCSSCFKDCGPCDTTKPCDGGCSGHGQCLIGTGLCDCAQPWTGPTCSSQGQTLNVTTNSTNPIVTVEPIGGSSAKNSAKFSISIKSISEFTNAHALVYSISLAEIEFSLTKEQNGENTKFNYSASLKNGAFISVILWQLGQATSLEFAHVNTTYPADTIKIYMDIFAWPFRALANSLEIVLDSSSSASGGKSTKNCVNSQEDESSSLQWLLVVVDDVALYGQFESKAVMDGRIQTISYALNQSDHSVSAILPHFWDSANLDPRFNVLLGDSKAKCGTHSKTNTKLILEIVIPVVVALILVSIIILLLAPRYVYFRVCLVFNIFFSLFLRLFFNTIYFHKLDK
eukprot:Phypoly_transcript_00869.p1 GENE.Phypoly_transcript_00869~~Phypoly_transcript_00869.p1  ORF type:complete len:1150 (+),score=116.12 Phypoly_transcript_00869:388-3837(+)